MIYWLSNPNNFSMIHWVSNKAYLLIRTFLLKNYFLLCYETETLCKFQSLYYLDWMLESPDIFFIYSYHSYFLQCITSSNYVIHKTCQFINKLSKFTLIPNFLLKALNVFTKWVKKGGFSVMMKNVCDIYSESSLLINFS